MLDQIGDGFGIEEYVGEGEGHGDGAYLSEIIDYYISHGSACGCLNMWSEGCEEDKCCQIGSGLALGDGISCMDKPDAYEFENKRVKTQKWSALDLFKGE